jgi:hypothetical protein
VDQIVDQTEGKDENGVFGLGWQVHDLDKLFFTQEKTCEEGFVEGEPSGFVAIESLAAEGNVLGEGVAVGLVEPIICTSDGMFSGVGFKAFHGDSFPF